MRSIGLFVKGVDRRWFICMEWGFPNEFSIFSGAKEKIEKLLKFKLIPERGCGLNIELSI